jgi:hypothetical protein
MSVGVGFTFRYQILLEPADVETGVVVSASTSPIESADE